MTGKTNNSTNREQGEVTPILFTRYTSETLLTKRVLYTRGRLKKIAAAMMFNGKYETIEVNTLEEFIDELQATNHNQAFGYGMGPAESGKITTKKREGNGAIARSKKNFRFRNGAGVMLLDIDPRKDGKRYSADEVHEKLINAVPELKDIKMACCASTSSNIVAAMDIHEDACDDTTPIKHDKGDVLKPAGGWHFYAFIKDARKIPAIGKIISKRLWQAGEGYCLITSNGVQYERCLVDTCVWQGERLDFVAGADCHEGLVEQLDTPVQWFGVKPMLMNASMRKLTQVENRDYRIAVDAEMADKKPAADKVRKQWFAARVDDIVGTGATRQVKKACMDTLKKQVKDQVLPLDFVLYLEEGMPITVKDLLADPGKYHGFVICDPFEPEYRGWDANTTVSLKGKEAHLCSFSHGMKKVFTFVKEAKESNDLADLDSDSEKSKAIAERVKDKLLWDEKAEEWCRYVNEHWEKMANTDMDKELCGFLDKEIKQYTAAFFGNMLKFLRIRLGHSEWEQNKHLLPMKNGILDVKTMTLLPHSHTYKFQWALPYDYDPAATCPVTRQYLLDAVDDDPAIVEILRAAMFFSLLYHPGTQKFMEILGPGGTGKSAFVRLIQKLLGEVNCMTTDLKNLEDNKFETSGLYGKRAAFINDSSRYQGSTSQLKAISGEDPLRFEKKNVQQGNSFIAECMLYIVSNEPIQSNDYTSGLSRRRVPVHFLKQITDVDKEKWRAKGGIEKVMASELPGILNWVIAMGAKDALKALGGINGELSNSQRIHLLETNPLAAWCEENCVIDPTAVTFAGVAPDYSNDQNVREELTSTRLYTNYHAWCKGNGHKPSGTQRFTTTLEDLLKNQLKYPVTRKRLNNGRAWLGIGLRSNYSDISSFSNINTTSSSKLNIKDIETPILREVLMTEL